MERLSREDLAPSDVSAEPIPRLDEDAQAIENRRLLSDTGSLSRDALAPDARGIDAASVRAPNASSGPALTPTETEVRDLPTGADKSGVTSKAISVPQGSGKIEGMGESFSAQLSTGIATFSVPFAIPAARGGAQPSLGLSYSSAGGLGIAGMGWSVGVPFIARETDRGLPKYDDRETWHPEQDRFVFNGGQELVPICTVGASPTLACAGALAGEQMPPWGAGHQYFRPRVEGSFLRFFWSPDHRTWRVQDKSGVTMELGVPLDGSGDPSALERNPDAPKQIYKWHLVRQYDTYGDANPAGAALPNPVNKVVYKYVQDGGMAYLSEIFHTTPVSQPSTSDTTKYAHHVRLSYESRPDPTFGFRTGWRIDQRLRLMRVDVATKPFNGNENGARRMVRRYHLAYRPGQHTSLLESVQVEGRCATPTADPNTIVSEDNAIPEGGNHSLPDVTGCPRLPAMKFGYEHVEPFTTNGKPGIAGLSGYEGFDERLRDMATSPPHSVDEALTDLFDIDSDALPDVLVTAPGTYGNGHGVFFNGQRGAPDAFGAATPISVEGVLGANASTIKLSNLNLKPLDLDGDATIDLLHMPRVKTYSTYRSELRAGAWAWVGREVDTASGQNPKIDFGNDTLDTKVVDVNFDGLVDVVVSTGTRLQTFFALGRYPGGDGQFGAATRTSATTSLISNDPVATCVPHSATPVRFSDGDIHLAEMNGDGIADIVRIRRGDVQYWPGRGNGLWGTGKLDDCPADTFGANRYIEMADPPVYSDIQATTLRIDDVNGDGLDDLVQVRYDAVDIWLNVDGVGWTKRHIIAGTPASPSYANRVRLVDVNGSGTRDILWGNANKYRYIDLAGGKRPHVLTRVENGLGKSTDIEYTTSTAAMLAAQTHGGACAASEEPWSSPWCTKMPTVAHVVKRVTESDNLAIAGKPPGVYITEYSYRDPVFEGRQREFRGFAKARARRLGDDNSPTDVTESTFLLGECLDETVGSRDNGVDDCSIPERWRDNPREALKGLPVLTEKYDETGVYLSAEAMRYRLRRLYVGQDGREVRHAFQSGTRSIRYDTAAGPAQGGSVADLLTVELELSRDPALDPLDDPEALPAGLEASGETAVPLRAGSGYAILESSSAVDFFGNRVVAINRGCVSGPACAQTDETIYSFTEPGLPDGERTGWLFRTVRSHVSGSVHTARRGETLITYSSEGAPTLTEAVLEGTVALERAVASPPVNASADADASDPVFVSLSAYNALGMPTSQQGANNRCRAIDYNVDAYGVLPTLEQVFRGGCNNAPLASSAIYDRGLGLVTTAVDMQTQSTFVDYDGFGRLRELRRPDPLTEVAKNSRLPSVKIEYFLPGSGSRVAHSIIRTQSQDGETPQQGDYLESFSYVDGLGRTCVTLAETDPTEGAQQRFIAADLSEYDSKSAVRRKYLPFFTAADPMAFPFGVAQSVSYGRQRYDAFGRQLQTFDLDGTVTLQSRYHALSTDLFDAADLYPGPHQNTPASTRTDGHGRTIATTERIHVNGAIEAREIRTEYLPTGEPRVITRVRVGKADPPVVRWMRYDSLGRMVLNVEPNTSQNFDPDPETNPAPGPSGLKAWRYAYNDAGDLVGTSDARGCGVNFFYDGAGRLIGEDYAPCEPHHTAYSAPSNLANGTGLEVLYAYDSTPAHFPEDFFMLPDHLTSGSVADGRLIGVFDRASATMTRYDRRGRVTRTDVRIYRTNAPEGEPFSNRYASRWFSKDFAYDAADREIASTTGATPEALQGEAVTRYGFPVGRNASVVETTYSRRGTVQSVGGSYKTLVSSIGRAADGLVNDIVYGDAAQTTTSFSYDDRRRVSSVQTYRGWPHVWNAEAGYTPAPTPETAATSFQQLLQDEEYKYDVVNNPTEIRDWRIPEDWPAGAKPVSKKIEYDDLYRVSRVSYEHTGGADSWTDPFEADENPQLSDPRRAEPSPRLSFAGRMKWQTFQYDWLGNTSKTDDDAKGFYDRSLGNVTNDVAGGKPYQLKNATNKAGGLGSNGNPTPNGEMQAAYDAAGNLVRLDLERNGTCIGGQCSQRFNYRWDEVGRLVRALRWDVAYAPGAAFPADGSAAADLRYLYNASDQRVLKFLPGANLHTLYVFDSLELRGADLNGGGFEASYPASEETHVPYLVANGVRLARVVLEQEGDGEPRLSSETNPRLHVFFELGDHLGSTSVVLDQATSELVERSTYQAYGGAESDYRTERWKGFREDYRFTGKEEDVEVGLQYFGKRYLTPALGRWMSADPLMVHLGDEADLNLYAYVSGNAFAATDAIGLSACGGDCSGVADYPPSAGSSNSVGSDDIIIGGLDANTYNTESTAPVEDRYVSMSCRMAFALQTDGMGICEECWSPVPPPPSRKSPEISLPPDSITARRSSQTYQFSFTTQLTDSVHEDSSLGITQSTVVKNIGSNLGPHGLDVNFAETRTAMSDRRIDHAKRWTAGLEEAQDKALSRLKGVAEAYGYKVTRQSTFVDPLYFYKELDGSVRRSAGKSIKIRGVEVPIVELNATMGSAARIRVTLKIEPRNPVADFDQLREVLEGAASVPLR